MPLFQPKLFLFHRLLLLLHPLKNVFLLPHLGSATTETREAMGFRVFDNIKAFFDNKEPIDRVV